MPGPTCKWLSEPRRFVNVPHGVADIRRSLIVVLPRRAVLPTGWGGGAGGGGPRRAAPGVRDGEKKNCPRPGTLMEEPAYKMAERIDMF